MRYTVHVQLKLAIGSYKLCCLLKEHGFKIYKVSRITNEYEYLNELTDLLQYSGKLTYQKFYFLDCLYDSDVDFPPQDLLKQLHRDYFVISFAIDYQSELDSQDTI